MNWIKKNIVVIVFILTIVSDTIFQVTKNLDLSDKTLTLLRVIGAVVAVLMTQIQAIKEEQLK